MLGITRISLLKGKKMWLAILVPGFVSIGFFNFSVNQNNQTLDWLLKQDNLISGIAILLTFEAILIVFLTVFQIKSYYKLKFPSLWKWISIVPPVQLMVAFIFLQTYLFLKVSGYSFIWLAFTFFLSSILILWILTFGMQKLIKRWENRAELQALIALFQLLLAMFLPLIARGQKVGFTQITVDYHAIMFLMTLVIILSATGYFMYKRKLVRPEQKKLKSP
ncbi:MAG: hypothetical protein CR989_01375 [Flavobacteriales bacterium]|nr:MAG: hypothetical protein CR989_01375 [Flavobacteriales bacterium]